MTKTRDNHYVSQWHQKGFMDDNENTLRHLKRKVIVTPAGFKAIFSQKSYTATQCFYQRDLYTTFFGSEINDEIERKLFGYIDDNGSDAVRAFLTDDQAQWHKYFQDLFAYLDAQKLRTPKGLDWVRSKYPSLSQNELMIEMQALRTIHCTLWAEGVRELVSAEDSEVKFIVSDHPITIYNYACPPDSKLCNYPNDPDISLKGSQTIFPLNKNRCLILTNLEYAQDPDSINPLELRTNAKKTRKSMVNTIEFTNTRKLTADEVTSINHIIKSRAKESIAAGQEEWLYPEKVIHRDWAELRQVLLPPTNQLSHYAGEMYAKFADGSTHYQDAFGRTEPKSDYLNKDTVEAEIGRNDSCGCGSNRKYKQCCYGVPIHLRTTWAVLSIRERNLAFCRAITDILGLDAGKSWTEVRSEISNDQISKIYGFYAALWPRDTDIYSMLPKSDIKFRALYTGPLDVRNIGVYALGMATHFDEILIENPIINPNTVKEEFSPIENPSRYKYQALKDFSFMLTLEPLIGVGLVNLIPDPIVFDQQLHREMISLARERKANIRSERDHRLHFRLTTQDLLNSTHSMPTDMKVQMLMSEFGLTEDKAMSAIDELEENAGEGHLTLLQPDVGSQFLHFSMGPNYEMSLFIAQVTGSVIITDSESRWLELQNAQHRVQGIANYPWSKVNDSLNLIPLDHESIDTFKKSTGFEFVQTRKLLKSTDSLVRSDNRIATEVELLVNKATALSEKLNAVKGETAEIKVLSPERGFYDKTVHRLLVRSGCPMYDDSVRSVYYIGKYL